MHWFGLVCSVSEARGLPALVSPYPLLGLDQRDSRAITARRRNQHNKQRRGSTSGLGHGTVPHVWSARLLAVFIFGICFMVVFWYALVHTVHLGTLSVPDLRVKTIEEAEQIAHDMGLNVVIEEPGVFSGTVAQDAIARQDPIAGFHIKTGSTVKVRLSLGSKRTAIPDIHGESLQSALRVLERSGLDPGLRAQVMYQSGGDRVLATDPPIGSEIPPSDEVNLLVNVAPGQELWVMPSLRSQPVDQVRRFCRNNYFRLGQVHDVIYPGMPKGIVLRQYPSAGSPLSRSDIITVWITQ